MDEPNGPPVVIVGGVGGPKRPFPVYDTLLVPNNPVENRELGLRSREEVPKTGFVCEPKLLVEVLGVVVVVEKLEQLKGFAAVEDELNRLLEPKPLEADCTEAPKIPEEVPKPDVVCGNL
ncbi:hypothetical protein BpHYR1_007229, partial [Brachionus plicatilis]